MMLVTRRGIRLEVNITKSSVEGSYYIVEMGGVQVTHMYAEPIISTEATIETLSKLLRYLPRNQLSCSQTLIKIYSKSNQPTPLTESVRLYNHRDYYCYNYEESHFHNNRGESQVEYLFRSQQVYIERFTTVLDL